MPATRSLNVTLPDDLAEMLDAKVASGEYASEGDVVRDGLMHLRARDSAVDEWLRTEVAATYDAHVRNPSRALAVDEVLASLERRFAAGREGPLGGI